MTSQPAQRPQDTRRKRTFTITVGLATVTSSILVICAGFIAMFTLGVLLGRGYDPEAGIPNLERILPQPASPAAPSIISANDTDNDKKPQPPKPDNKGILDQSDLAYQNSLRSKNTAAPKAQRQGFDSGQTTAPAQNQPVAKPQKTTADQSGVATITGNGTKPPTSENADQRTYNYVYQAAAYKDQESCDRFSAKVRAAGIKARTTKSTENGVTWYRVMVDFTGRPDDTETLRAKLQNLGVPKPLMRSKTPTS